MKKTIFVIMATIILVMGSCMTCFASETEYPNFIADHECIIYEVSGTYYAVTFQKEALEPHFQRLSNGSYSLDLKLIEGMEQYAYYSIYKYKNDGWTKVTDTEYVTNYGMVFYNVEYMPILYSDVDIYDSNTGELVFPPPRPVLEILLEKTETTIPQKVGGVMKTLTLCGVGCLALLMVLSLFGKVFSNFRVK